MKMKFFFTKFLLLIIIISLVLSCKKQDVEKEYTFSDLAKEYNLKLPKDQKNFLPTPGFEFKTALEAKAAFELIKKTPPLEFKGFIVRSTSDLHSIKIKDNSKLLSLLRTSQLDNSETISKSVFLGQYSVTLDWGSNYTNLNANGSISNILNLNSFTQLTTGSNSAQYNSNTGIIKFNIDGYQNYNVFVQGVGTVYQQPITMYGSYNTQTKETILNVVNR